MSVHEDAKKIRHAIKGLGTDDQVLCDIITKRSNEQLVAIAHEYKDKFDIKLTDDIKGDTSGNYKELLIGLVTPRAEYLAKTLHEAMKGAGTNDTALIDCLVHQSNHTLKEVAETYKKEYKKDLADDIKGDTSGDFKKILLGLIKGGRDESNHVNHDAAQKDAEHLYKKGEGKIGTDEDAFIEFFLTRNWAHIKEVDKCYLEKYKHGLDVALNKEFSGNIKKTLKALAMTRGEYWASRIYSSIEGLGTNDTVLVRAFVINHGPALKEVEAAYTARHARKVGKAKDNKKKGTLRQDIKGDTSGWYEKTLLALLD